MFSGDFLLVSTRERIVIPPDLAGRVEGRSSLGRCGLMVHITAGFIDPGFEGYLTLELHHVGNIPLILRPKLRIAQLTLEMLSSTPDRGYGDKKLQSKYQKQGKNPMPIMRHYELEE